MTQRSYAGPLVAYKNKASTSLRFFFADVLLTYGGMKAALVFLTILKPLILVVKFIPNDRFADFHDDVTMSDHTRRRRMLYDDDVL